MNRFDEIVTLYPETVPSCINCVQKLIGEEGPVLQQIKLKTTAPLQELERLLTRLLWSQLQSMGIFSDQQTTLAEQKKKRGIRELYDRWFAETIAILACKNYLHYDGKSCSVIDTTPVDMSAAWEEWDRKKSEWLDDPNMKAQVLLVETTLRSLPEILTGKRLATDIMFPNSSMALVEGVYKNNVVADYFNEVLADTVVTYVQERVKQDPAARMRILEIGAGTGGTSAMVLRKLKPHRDQIEEYCYTDISKAFLMHAEKQYAPDNPYLTCSIFNVEEPLAGQGVSAGAYDLVIATNVLHATTNIRATLRNAKAVLKQNGLFLINELSNNSLFTHLTFGLLEGWWRYEDATLRIPGSPGLYPDTWQTVLEGEGFRSILFPAEKAHDLGQQIVVAESDGVVRQKR